MSGDACGNVASDVPFMMGGGIEGPLGTGGARRTVEALKSGVCRIGVDPREMVPARATGLPPPLFGNGIGGLAC